MISFNPRNCYQRVTPIYSSSCLNLIFEVLYTVFINLDKNRFPESSILRIVVFFRGVTRDFPETRLTNISPKGSYMLHDPGRLHSSIRGVR